MNLVLRPFTRDELALIVTWFDDPETQRYLGGRDWPAQMLDLADTNVGQMFRGQRMLAAYRWLVGMDDQTVGYLDAGVMDCWTTCGPPDGSGESVVVDVIDGPAASFAIVVAPELRRRGIGRAMLNMLFDEPSLREVRVFGAGVEPENIESCRCLEHCGFQLQAQVPDWEGMLYYLRYA